ncbi:MAG: truA [Ignavibacteria bacterium]|nr:truA [Ignavibacteria bacterium]
MATLGLKIEYDGTDYCGWQRQANSITIQERVEIALEKLINKSISIIGAGRTDSGVHARGQVASALIDDDFPIPENKIKLALNSELPKDIRIIEGKFFNFPFHARFDAVAREYSYTVINKEDVFRRRFSAYYTHKMDEESLFSSAEMFLGKHDFTAFSKKNPDVKNYICKVEICKWEKMDDNSFRLKIKSDRFVYGMVRSLTSVMLGLAAGKLKKKEIQESFMENKRKPIAALMPPSGLILEKVYYNNIKFLD